MSSFSATDTLRKAIRAAAPKNIARGRSPLCSSVGWVYPIVPAMQTRYKARSARAESGGGAGTSGTVSGNASRNIRSAVGNTKRAQFLAYKGEEYDNEVDYDGRRALVWDGLLKKPLCATLKRINEHVVAQQGDTGGGGDMRQGSSSSDTSAGLNYTLQYDDDRWCDETVGLPDESIKIVPFGSSYMPAAQFGTSLYQEGWRATPKEQKIIASTAVVQLTRSHGCSITNGMQLLALDNLGYSCLCFHGRDNDND